MRSSISSEWREPDMPPVDEDQLFDDQLPTSMRVHAPVHFTRVAVAKISARLLAPDAGMRVLDVGSGPGKFCLVAARVVPEATFVGVELRPHFVKLARKLATRAALANVEFIHSNAMDLDWTAYDAFYLYNPFAEQLHDDAQLVLDRTLPRDPANFVAYVTGVRQRLAAARVGTRVVTYHGFGGPVPYGYDLIESHDERLQLWIKVRHVCNLEEEYFA